MAHIWYIMLIWLIFDRVRILRRKSVLFIGPNWAKNIKFGADADILYDQKVRWDFVACNVNQWDLYNRIAVYVQNMIDINQSLSISLNDVLARWYLTYFVLWSKHTMQCNTVVIERWTNKRSSKAWWSYLILTFVQVILVYFDSKKTCEAQHDDGHLYN